MRNIICILMIITGFTNLKALAPVEDYVSVSGKKLVCQGQPFYATGMNYLIDVINDNGNEYIAPTRSYGPEDAYETNTEQEGFDAIVADLQLLKSLGFNSIRLVLVKCNAINMTYHTYTYGWWSETPVAMSPPYSNVFGFIERALEAAEIADVKVIYLVNGQQGALQLSNPPYLDYLAALANHFKDNTTLMAYDFFNEPEYVESGQNDKSVVCAVVKQWSAAVHANSPYHLTTIGYVGPSEAQEWDPTILDVDFASFHPYHLQVEEGDNMQQAINRIKSEIYWMGQNMQIPWMIGETSIAVSSDVNYLNDQGTPEDQRNYAEQTMEATRDCGGCGYMWWSMYDTYEANPIERYRGIINNNCILKPVALEFNAFDPQAVQACGMPPGYYNSEGYSQYWISGQVIDQNNQPIEHAVIMGSTDAICFYGSQFHTSPYSRTYTNSSGIFILYANCPITKITIACPAGEAITITGPINNVSLPWPVQIDRFDPSTYHELSGFTFPMFAFGAVEATDYINATNVVIPGDGTTGANITMEAGNIIRLKTGFRAANGCSFRAWNGAITPECDDMQGYRLAPQSEEGSEVDSTITGANTLNAFPNPTDGIITIKKNAETSSTIEVVNMMGQTIIHPQLFTGTTTTVDLSDQAEGIYFIRVTTGEETETVRIVKMD